MIRFSFQNLNFAPTEQFIEVGHKGLRKLFLHCSKQYDFHQTSIEVSCTILYVQSCTITNSAPILNINYFLVMVIEVNVSGIAFDINYRNIKK